MNPLITETEREALDRKRASSLYIALAILTGFALGVAVGVAAVNLSSERGAQGAQTPPPIVCLVTP